MYQGGQHLLRYLKHVGYGGLMMSVWADGSSIYPSQHLQPTPRYDTGVFFGTGQDPLRKDALEMLFRMFDREGLTLIPALHFGSPLPELEELKREGEAVATGIEWIGADGQNWLASHAPRQGLAPYYNLLDPRVQDAMLTVIRELGTRYAAHPSFGGLAMQLSAEGYAQLPGDNWGYDDRTIARFEKEAKTKVPGDGETRFATRAKHLAGPARAAWLSWRADVVADFHRRVEREVAAMRSGAKLYLAGGAMLDGRHAQTRLATHAAQASQAGRHAGRARHPRKRIATNRTSCCCVRSISSRPAVPCPPRPQTWRLTLRRRWIGYLPPAHNRRACFFTSRKRRGWPAST